MVQRGIELKTPEQLIAMRRAGLVVARALAEMTAAIRPGVTTAEVDRVARDVLAREKATSSFLGYAPGWTGTPYPAVLCISPNEVIVHGIPSERVIQAGDLVSIDFGAEIGGFHGDAARTVEVDPVTPAARRLNQVTRESLWAGIAAVRRGATTGDIGRAIERSVRAAGRFAIIREFTGHGIGTAMHQDPDVPNYGRPGRGPQLSVGMCLAIEPMVVAGHPKTAVLDDDWTVVTADRSWAAHWENTVAITAHGLWVLTEEDGGEAELTRRGLPFAPLAD